MSRCWRCRPPTSCTTAWPSGHISFAEVASSAILCVPLTLALPAWLYSTAHLVMIAVQIVGSIWIRKLSPT